MHSSCTECVHWLFVWYLICHSNTYQSAHWIKLTFWYKFREMIFCQSIILTSIQFSLYFIKKITLKKVTLRNLSNKEAIIFQKWFLSINFVLFLSMGGGGIKYRFNNITITTATTGISYIFSSNKLFFTNVGMYHLYTLCDMKSRKMDRGII